MNTAEDPALDALFSALADPTRRAILAQLVDGDATVAQLTAPLSISQPAVSKHLKVLERAGLVQRYRDAQRRPVRVVAAALGPAADWLERYRAQWAQRFDQLDALLASLPDDPEDP